MLLEASLFRCMLFDTLISAAWALWTKQTKYLQVQPSCFLKLSHTVCLILHILFWKNDVKQITSLDGYQCLRNWWCRVCSSVYDTTHSQRISILHSYIDIYSECILLINLCNCIDLAWICHDADVYSVRCCTPFFWFYCKIIHVVLLSHNLW